MRVTTAVLVGALMGLALAPPASAAPPERDVRHIGADVEAELEGLLTSACGFPVTVQGTGKVISLVFTRDGQVVRAQDIYSTRFTVTNVATGARFVIRDTGPDRLLFEDGEPVVLQQIGRSTTASGTIGRTVFDVRGGGMEERSRSGRPYGDYVARTCAALG